MRSRGAARHPALGRAAWPDRLLFATLWVLAGAFGASLAMALGPLGGSRFVGAFIAAGRGLVLRGQGPAYGICSGWARWSAPAAKLITGSLRLSQLSASLAVTNLGWSIGGMPSRGGPPLLIPEWNAVLAGAKGDDKWAPTGRNRLGACRGWLAGGCCMKTLAAGLAVSAGTQPDHEFRKPGDPNSGVRAKCLFVPQMTWLRTRSV